MTRSFDEKQDPRSYVSLFSSTPGKLTKEVEQINEGFRCGRDKVVDLVTFSVRYSCWTFDDTDSGWSESDVPTMHVDSDTRGDERITRVLIDTKGSTRWTLAVNADEIEDFTFKGVCRASQVADLFPTVSPEIVVREARLEDCWEVAETHCSSFFPEYSFPLDFVLRIDRLVAMLAGFSLPNGCKRTCLVAVIGNSIDETFLFGSEDFNVRRNLMKLD